MLLINKGVVFWENGETSPNGEISYRIESAVSVWGSYAEIDQVLLKRFLSILNDLILDSRVDRAMPSLAAAPELPETRPLDSRKAVSIASFSSVASICERPIAALGPAAEG